MDDDDPFNKENEWFYLKGECYRALDHIEEFRDIQRHQETRSVCSYIIDRSSTTYSEGTYGGSKYGSSIYSSPSSLYSSTLVDSGGSATSGLSSSGYDNVKYPSSDFTSPPSYIQDDYSYKKPPTGVYLTKDPIWRDDQSTSSYIGASNLTSSTGSNNAKSIMGYMKDSSSTSGASNYITGDVSPGSYITNNVSNPYAYQHNFRNSNTDISTYLKGSIDRSPPLASSTGSSSSGNENAEVDQGSVKQELPWNESFQQILDQPVRSLEDEKQRNQLINHFSEMLANQAAKYVKTLVKEVHIMPSVKTIKPCTSAGGFAGGEKYKIDNMFIKFALNPYGIYEQGNPTSYFANKSAGHELKSINALVSCGVPNLHLPLLCLLNYRGFRLSVISELPISSNTIVFGSGDAGLTIHHDPTVYNMLVKVGELLNLKNHLSKETRPRKTGTADAPASKLEGYSIPLAVDIEGHFGYDGRYYLVDAARLFPCETPAAGVTGGFLYRLLRGELVKKFDQPLSSDAFSSFNLVAPEKDNEAVRKASKFLVQTVVPRFVNEVLVFAEPKKLNLKDVLQKEGINMRYLGLVLHYINSHQGLDGARRALLQTKISVEMLARLLRFIVFSEMRRLNEKEDEPHLLIAITHINLLLSNHLAGNPYIYWSEFITNALIAKFTLSFHIESLPIERNNVTQLIRASKGLYQYISTGGKTHYKLLKKVMQLTGIIISPAYLDIVRRFDPNAPKNPLTISDIVEIQVTVKHMKVVSNFKTFEQFSDAERYYRNELEYKIEKLGSNNTQVAVTHIHLAELYGSYAMLQKAEDHLTLAIDIYKARFGNNDINTIHAMEKLGLLNIKQKLFDKSQGLFNEVLAIKKRLYLEKQTTSVGQLNYSQGMIEIADTLDNIAWCHQNKRQIPEATSNYSEALKIKAEFTGNSMTTAKTLNNLGHLFLSTNESQKALEIFLKVKEIFIQHQGYEHLDVATAHDNLGMVYSKLQNYPEGERAFITAINIRSKQFGAKSRVVAITQDHLAQLYVSWDKSKHDAAERIFLECIQIVDQSPDYYSRAFVRYNLSKLYRVRRDRVSELKQLNNSLSIFERHNISSDLLPKIRSRIDSLSKSKMSKMVSFLKDPVLQSKPLFQKYTQPQQNFVIESQQVFGHMEMSNNHKFIDTSIPKEWLDILTEVGITKEQMMDPAYAATIQSIINEAFEAPQPTSPPPKTTVFTNPLSFSKGTKSKTAPETTSLGGIVDNAKRAFSFFKREGSSASKPTTAPKFTTAPKPAPKPLPQQAIKTSPKLDFDLSTSGGSIQSNRSSSPNDLKSFDLDMPSASSPLSSSLKKSTSSPPMRSSSGSVLSPSTPTESAFLENIASDKLYPSLDMGDKKRSRLSDSKEKKMSSEESISDTLAKLKRDKFKPIPSVWMKEKEKEMKNKSEKRKKISSPRNMQRSTDSSPPPTSLPLPSQGFAPTTNITYPSAESFYPQPQPMVYTPTSSSYESVPRPSRPMAPLPPQSMGPPPPQAMGPPPPYQAMGPPPPYYNGGYPQPPPYASTPTSPTPPIMYRTSPIVPPPPGSGAYPGAYPSGGYQPMNAQPPQNYGPPQAKTLYPQLSEQQYQAQLQSQMLPPSYSVQSKELSQPEQEPEAEFSSYSSISPRPVMDGNLSSSSSKLYDYDLTIHYESEMQFDDEGYGDDDDDDDDQEGYASESEGDEEENEMISEELRSESYDLPTSTTTSTSTTGLQSTATPQFNWPNINNLVNKDKLVEILKQRMVKK